GWDRQRYLSVALVLAREEGVRVGATLRGVRRVLRPEAGAPLVIGRDGLERPEQRLVPGDVVRLEVDGVALGARACLVEVDHALQLRQLRAFLLDERARRSVLRAPDGEADRIFRARQRAGLYQARVDACDLHHRRDPGRVVVGAGPAGVGIAMRADENVGVWILTPQRPDDRTRAP